jgi:hypothetical protein
MFVADICYFVWCFFCFVVAEVVSSSLGLVLVFTGRLKCCVLAFYRFELSKKNSCHLNINLRRFLFRERLSTFSLRERVSTSL